MRWMIIDTDYGMFLNDLAARHPGLASMTFAEQQRIRFDSAFAQADFYDRHLRPQGHQMLYVYLNNPAMQNAWYLADEAHRFGVLRRPIWSFRYRVLDHPNPEGNDLILHQVRRFRPQVVICQTSQISGELLREISRFGVFIIGDFAVPVDPGTDLRPYDLMISAAPDLVEVFRAQGKTAEHHPLGFEHTLLQHLPPRSETYGATFVGRLTKGHQKRISWLERVTARLDVDLWGEISGVEEEPERLVQAMKPPLWGRDMLALFRAARLTLNRHVDSSATLAVNMRMFEATGCGTLLITDWAENLADYFEPEREVVTYHDPEECADKARWFLDHDEERRRIAAAGHARCLAEHTYAQRARRLEALVRSHMGERAAR